MLPLVKHVPVGLRHSHNFKWSHLLPERNAGAEFHHELLKSIDSLIPRSIYSRLSWALGPDHFDVFEVTSNIHFLKTIQVSVDFHADGNVWRLEWLV